MNVTNPSNATSFLNSCGSFVGGCLSDSECLKSVAGITIVSIIAIGIFKCTSYYCCKHKIKKWKTSSGNELTLLQKRTDLYWEFLDTRRNKRYTSVATDDIRSLESYAKDARKDDRALFFKQIERVKQILENGDKEFDPVKWLRTIPLKNRIAFFKANDFAEAGFILNIPVLKNVELILKMLPSFYGGINAKISRDTWAVTILCRSGKEYQCDFGHAVIAYEGVRDGVHFVHYAHLAEDKAKPGFGIVLPITNRILDKKSNMSQSTTWLKPSYKVTAMIESIEEDIQRQKKGKPYTFSLDGGGLLYLVPDMISAFSRSGSTLRVNCHTWTTMTLKKADINAERYLDSILAVPAIQTPFL